MILLTGASKGIGKEITTDLAKFDHVVGFYNSSLPIASTNNRLTYKQINLKDATDIRTCIKEFGDKISNLTLIHSAALNIDGLAANYVESDWEQVMKVNLSGNFLLTQAVLPYMIKERWGRIIHFSSVVGMRGGVGTIAYSTSKTGLLGMSRSLAKEYARFNITSNILVLGYFEVGLIDTLDDTHKKKILNEIPSKSFGKVSNITNAIEFLIKSEYVNGSVINIDGGI